MVAKIKQIVHIQKEYFKLLRSHMLQEQSILRECENSIPFAIKRCVSSSNRGIVIPGKGGQWESPLQSRLRALLMDVRKFWFDNGHDFLKNLGDENLLYVWPIHSTRENERYIKRHGLYFDTIIKDCALFLLAEEAIDIVCKRESWINSYLNSYFTLLDLERFVLLETEPPVCIICPSPEILANSDGKTFSGKIDQGRANELENSKLSISFLLNFFEEVSDGAISSNSLSELRDELSSLGNTNLLALIQDKELFRGCLFDTEESIIQYITELSGKEAVPSYRLDPMRSYVTCEEIARDIFDIETMFRTILRLLTSTAHTGADPALSPAYWKLYLWMLKKSANDVNRSLRASEDEVAARILQSKNLSWLEAIDVQSLVKIRENKGLEELRSTIRKQRVRIKRATIDNFDRIFSSVDEELNNALTDHSKRIEKERDNTKRVLAWGGASFIVTTALSLASLALPTLLPLAVGSALTSIVIGGKSIRELINEHLSGKEHLKELASRPIALLAEAKERYSRDQLNPNRSKPRY